MKNYKMMNKFFCFLLTLVFCLSSMAQNSEEAKKLLDEVSAKMNSYNDIRITFDYMFENKDAGIGQEVSTGDAILKGDKYVVNIFGITRIFDGKEIYTVIHENEEVNITGSDEEGSVIMTPSEMINFHKSDYNYQMGKTDQIDGKKVQYVHLIPIDSTSEISLVIIGVDVNKFHIYTVQHIGKNLSETTIKIKKIEFNQNLADQLFSFNEQEYEAKNYMINR